MMQQPLLRFSRHSFSFVGARAVVSLACSTPAPSRAAPLLIPLTAAPTPARMQSSSSSSDRAAAAIGTGASSSRRLRVYTRTGDKGTTSLFNGDRHRKDEVFFQCLGDVDELNACIGIAREHCAVARVGIEDQLVEIQSLLLDIGSAIATPVGSSTPEQLERVQFGSQHAATLEGWIDAMDDQLPPLRNFILPSGGLSSAHLHLARTVARRAERGAVSLVLEQELPNEVQIFLNRLSDYLFVAARFAAMQTGASEQVYKRARGIVERSLAAATESPTE